MKALNNYVSAAGLVATAEALIVGQKFGLDGAAMVKILNASTGRNNTTENKADRYMLSRKFDSGFALALMEKDVGMARRLSRNWASAPTSCSSSAATSARRSLPSARTPTTPQCCNMPRR